MTESPYALLGVRPDATDADVKAAWLERISVCHPDRVAQQSPEARAAAEERTKRLNGAYAEVKRLRAANGAPAARSTGPSQGAGEPQSAIEALRRAHRAAEDAGAAQMTALQQVALLRAAADTLARDLPGREARVKKAVDAAAQAAALADPLERAARDAVVRAVAGEAMSVIGRARALAPRLVKERQVQLARAETLAAQAFSALPAGKTAARMLVEDAATRVDALYRAVRPVAAELETAAEKGENALRQHRKVAAALPTLFEPVSLAIDGAVVAAARAAGLAEAEGVSVEAQIAAQWRAQAVTATQAAARLASAQAAPRPPLPAAEDVLAHHARLKGAAEAARDALRKASAANDRVRALRDRGPDALVSDALRFVDAELSALRAELAGS